jgi:hypothetical protein
VAKTLVQTGDLRWAARLLGAALEIGNWSDLPLALVAGVSAEVIRAIANATVQLVGKPNADR